MSNSDALDSTLPQPRLPLDIILAIFEHIPLPLAIGFSKWNAGHTDILLIDRTIYSATIARVYHTVVIQTSKILREFLDTLGSSPHLGPLIHDLWINHEDCIGEGSWAFELPRRYTVTTNALATFALTPNLRRLAIASPLYYDKTHLSSTLPFNIGDLTVPSSWVGMPPNGIGESILSDFPVSLRALRIRGRVGVEEADRIVTHCPAIRYVYVRVFGGNVLEDLKRFTSVLLDKLKEILSLELTVLSAQEKKVLAYLDGMKQLHTDVDTKVSVRVNDDNGKDELRSWLDRNESNGPAWAALVTI